MLVYVNTQRTIKLVDITTLESDTNFQIRSNRSPNTQISKRSRTRAYPWHQSVCINTIPQFPENRTRNRPFKTNRDERIGGERERKGEREREREREGGREKEREIRPKKEGEGRDRRMDKAVEERAPPSIQAV